MSTSCSEAIANVLAWRAERFPLALFGPAAAILTLASVTGPSLPAMPGLAHRLSLALIALLGLRLWDDLMDRALDAQTHPHRVLVRASPRPFVLVVSALLLLALALALALSATSALLFGLLCAGLAAFYRWRPGLVILLLKYPVLVLLLRGELDPVGVAAMGVIYGGMVLDEYAVRGGREGRWIRAVAMGATVILLLLLGFCKT